jgi:hypothetical protein
MRYTPVPFGEPIGWKPVNYLLEVGFTRDIWAHRIDIHAAIGRPVDLDLAHDGRLVADIAPSGRSSTENRSTCSSPAPPAAPSDRAMAANMSRWTHSTSSALSPAGSPGAE